MKDFLRAPDLSQFKFAMFYETWNLGFDPVRESTPVTFQMELHFDADMLSLRSAISRTVRTCASTGDRSFPLPDRGR